MNALLRLSARLLSWMPLSWIHRLARPAGLALRHLPWRKHAVIARNLKACFPELDHPQLEALHRAHLVELLKLSGELGALACWPATRLDRHLPLIEGWEAVEQARAEGKGILLVSGHLGNWEIVNLELSRRLSLATLYLAPENAGVDAFISRARGRFGGSVIPSGSAAMRQLLRQLRAGQAAAIAADIQPKQGDGVFADFFGIPALSMTLVNRLARRTGCAVILCWGERLDHGKGWALRFERAEQTIADADPALAMACMNRWLEEAIRQAPAQYLWIYKRFSRRPEGEPRFYPKS